jgi:hypothetical protein
MLELRMQSNALCTAEEMDLIKKECELKRISVSDLIEKKVSNGSYGALDRSYDIPLEIYQLRSRAIAGSDAVKRVEENYRLAAFFNQEEINIMVDFIDQIKNAKTNYFEIKVKDVVALDEFTTAFIPNDASNRVRQILAKNGIQVIEYDPELKDARILAVRRFANPEVESPSQGRAVTDFSPSFN